MAARLICTQVKGLEGNQGEGSGPLPLRATSEQTFALLRWLFIESV